MSALLPVSELPFDLASAIVPAIITELPGPEARRMIERDQRVASPSMGRVYPLVPKRGAGMVIEDVDGNRFLDFNAGIAVTSTGHCHPQVTAAIELQARTLLHYCSSDWYHPIYIELCERLAASAPVHDARVFLANSGTEAVEASIKLARYSTGRPDVIAFLGAFHGRSLGSLALTASKAKYRSGFGAPMAGVYHAPYGESGYIERVIFNHLADPGDIAAIVVEPIQGEGGYIVPPAGWLGELRDLCTAHGIVLVADEVQSGVGRTGRMWAVEHEGIEPDVLLAGKGLASGLPLAAVVARGELMRSWGPGKHGSTFGGNPVACAAALATLDLIDESLGANATRVGEHLQRGLADLQRRCPQVREVRGRGLMIGIEFESPAFAHEVEQAAFRRGLLVLTCGASSLRLAPPLVVTETQAVLALTLLEAAISEVALSSAV
jgi:4-aminobutyrate aminotransferase